MPSQVCRPDLSLNRPSSPFVILLASGEVYEVGPGVEGLKKGDRVAIEAGLPCGECEECRVGRYNACKDVVFFSTPPYHGLLTRYHAHPASWVHCLPDNISFEEGALLEPLAVALAGIERANLRLGDSLLIWLVGALCIAQGVCAETRTPRKKAAPAPLASSVCSPLVRRVPRPSSLPTSLSPVSTLPRSSSRR